MGSQMRHFNRVGPKKSERAEEREVVRDRERNSARVFLKKGLAEGDGTVLPTVRTGTGIITLIPTRKQSQ